MTTSRPDDPAVSRPVSSERTLMTQPKRFTCRRIRWQKQWAIVAMIALIMSTFGAPRSGRVVHAQGGPAAVGFVLDAGDLRFILRQIQIAEAHAAGGQLLGPGTNQVPESRLPFGLRTVDGWFNHLTTGKTGFGAADRWCPRLTTPGFRPAGQNKCDKKTR